MSDEFVLTRLLEYQPDLHNTRRFEFVWVIKKMMKKQGFALDIGCNGSILDKYVNENLDYTMLVVDKDPSAACYYNKTERTNFLLHDCLLPLPAIWKGVFDFITIVSTLEHIPSDNAIKMLKNAAECLNKSGSILITVPYGSGSAMQGKWPVWCYNEKNIEQISTLAGLKVASWEVSKKDLKSDLPIICIELTKK